MASTVRRVMPIGVSQLRAVEGVIAARRPRSEDTVRSRLESWLRRLFSNRDYSSMPRVPSVGLAHGGNVGPTCVGIFEPNYHPRVDRYNEQAIVPCGGIRHC